MAAGSISGCAAKRSSRTAAGGRSCARQKTQAPLRAPGAAAAGTRASARPRTAKTVKTAAQQSPVITLPRNWSPRPDQRPLWDYLESGGKRAVMVAHRRWGKDEVALHFAAVAAMQRTGNYWHMLPQYGQARQGHLGGGQPAHGHPPHRRGVPRRDQAQDHRRRDAHRACERLDVAACRLRQLRHARRLAARRHRLFRVRRGGPHGVGLFPADPGGERRLGALHLHAARAQPRQDPLRLRAP